MFPTEQMTLIDDRYEIGRPLDGGGMGVVYRAVDRRLSRPVAVKLVRTTDARLAERLMLEARLLARVDHPNVVRVYDAGTHQGRPYIVTELVPGPPLSRLVGCGPIDPGAVAAIGAGAAAGLAASHSAGIVHRDLKPANILISEHGIVRLLDYGVASSTGAAGLTLDGEVVGTPRYLAPEQASGGEVGPAADVYALGLVLLECLTGTRPFEGTVVESMTARLVSGPEIPLSVGASWRSALIAMTSRVPASRPSADDVADLLAPLSIGSDLSLLAAAAEVTTSTTTLAPGTIREPSTDTTTMLQVAAGAPTSELPVVELTTQTATGPVGRPRSRSHRRGWLIAVIVFTLLAVAGAALGARILADGANDPATSPSSTAPTSTIPPSSSTTRAPATTTTAKPKATTTTTELPTTTTTKGHGRPGKGGKPGG